MRDDPVVRIERGFRHSEALIDAAMEAWPDIADRVAVEFQATPAKTKEYLRRRGLSPPRK